MATSLTRGFSLTMLSQIFY